MNRFSHIVGLSLLFGTLALAGDAPPATQPAPPLIGQARPATLAARSFVYIEVDCTINDMMSKLGPAINAIEQIADDEDMTRTSGIICRYPKGVDFDGGHFPMQIGFTTVKEFKLQSPKAAETRLPAFKCETLVYTGPMSHLIDGYNALYDAIKQAGLKPTSDFRENYYYWESADSDNNVVQLQVGVE